MAGKDGKIEGESVFAPATNPVELSSRYEAAEFQIKAARNSQASTWVVAIMDHCGDVVWDQEGEGQPPASLKWNGTTLQGEPAVPGTYSTVLMLRGPSSLQQVSKTVSFKLKRPLEGIMLPVNEGVGGY